jgi:membrane protease YdiL (CAAX protease family)
LFAFPKRGSIVTAEATGLVDKVKSYPLLSFFALTFAISWTIWFIAPIIAGGNKGLANLIDLIGAYGPAVAAIIISAITHPEPSGASRKKRLVTFTAVFAVSCAIELVALAASAQNSLDTTAVAIVLPLIAAYVVSSVYHPKNGVAQLMSGLKRVSLKSVWVWVALLLPFAWQFTGALLDYAFGGSDLLNYSAVSLVSVLLVYPTTFFFGGPLNEEPGWRGYATPKMLTKYSLLITGLAIGLIWSTWHFPLHITQFYGNGMEGFLFRFTYTVPFGVIATWLYSRSNGNLFACILLHSSINASSAMFGASSGQYAILIMVLTTAVIVVADKMYRKPQQTAHSENKKSPNNEHLQK